jgi:hypothetical protein
MSRAGALKALDEAIPVVSLSAILETLKIFGINEFPESNRPRDTSITQSGIRLFSPQLR